MISIRRDFIDAYVNLGEIYIRQSMYGRAIDIYERALRHAEYKNDLLLADLYYNIAIAKSLQLENGGANADSKSVNQSSVLVEIADNFVRAIDINPEHRESLINLAIHVQRPEFSGESHAHYRRYVLQALRFYSKSAQSEVFQFNIAITLLDLGGPNNRLEAIEHLKRAVEIKPDYRSALYNLALLYYDFKDYNSSLHYLNQTTAYHSNYTKALLLMADIYSRMDKMNLTEKVGGDFV